MMFDRIGAATTESERFARLRLLRTARIGPVNFTHLLARFGSAERALSALPDIVQRKGGGFLPAPVHEIEAELARGRSVGARLILLGDAEYPALLSEIAAAPPVLWSLGSRLPLRRKAIAIVGARNASAAGQKIAAQLAQELAEAGYDVVSGLARGIDARAHEAALKTGTIAVLGGGPDDIYPPENAALYEAVKAQGLIISESPPGHRAQARDFPRRNRIISGLSLGVVVVEAELKSGSLITARQALEQNREVFAVPGSPLDPRSKGTNDLLRNGANLCETALDVTSILEPLFGMSEMGDTPSWSPPPELKTPAVAMSDNDIDKLRAELMRLISYAPTERSELLRGLDAPAQAGLAALSELEITGLVSCVDGAAYVRA